MVINLATFLALMLTEDIDQNLDMTNRWYFKTYDHIMAERIVLLNHQRKELKSFYLPPRLGGDLSHWKAYGEAETQAFIQQDDNDDNQNLQSVADLLFPRRWRNRTNNLAAVVDDNGRVLHTDAELLGTQMDS